MPRLKPATTTDPIMKLLFAEQDRLAVPVSTLARNAGLSRETIYDLRRPTAGGKGKRPTLLQVRVLAQALDFDLKLVKRD